MKRTLIHAATAILLLTSSCMSWSDFERPGTGGGGAGGTGGGTASCTPGETRECYSGPAGTKGIGACKAGQETCNDDGSSFGPCIGQLTPAAENCAPSAPEDEDCDGTALVCDGHLSWGVRAGDAFQQKSTAVAADLAGNVAVAGHFIGTMAFGNGTPTLTSEGGPNIFAAKLDAGGAALWAVRFGDAGTLNITGRAAVDPAGNVVLAGHFNGTVDFGDSQLTSTGGSDLFVAMLDPAGALMWARRFGGDGAARLSAAAVDPTGALLLAGSFEGTVDFGNGGTLTSAGSNDIFAVKLDPSGAPLWASSFGDAQGSAEIAADDAGNVVLAGYFGGTMDLGVGEPLLSAGASDAFVAKLDPGGTPLWARRFGDEQSQGIEGIAFDSSGNVLVTGYFNGTMDVSDGKSLASAGASDVFVVKLDPAGVPLWARRFGDEQPQWATGAAVDAAGNLVVTGYFNGTMDLGSGKPLTSAGAGDVFVVKVDPLGVPLWGRRFGDDDAQESIGVAVDEFGNAVVAGSFNGAIELDDGTALTSAGNFDIFTLLLRP